MIDKICEILTNKIRKKVPGVDEERAEIINYGLQNIIGELPKIILILILAYILGILIETIITFFSVAMYKSTSGGVHLKTHIGCMVMSMIFYCMIPCISKMFIIKKSIKIILVLGLWVFGLIMIKLYAPADTENVPILSLRDRKKKRILSYFFYSLALIISLIIKNEVISNIIILANTIQTLMITKFIYKITNNKYGYEVYQESV